MNKANKKLHVLDVSVTNFITLKKTNKAIKNISAKSAEGNSRLRRKSISLWVVLIVLYVAKKLLFITITQITLIIIVTIKGVIIVSLYGNPLSYYLEVIPI